ncbi:MAG: S41 family peptidase [Ruminococcus sp.]|nr:S41 family peptidase [Ruminococcus sp.]
MNKKISLGLAISLIAIACAITYILTTAFSLNIFNGKISEVTDMAAKYERLDALDAYVREHYYGEIDEEDLTNGILKGYVSGLNDPYASYMTPEEYQESMSDDKGVMTGIGISVIMDESGYMLITEITDNSPAASSELAIDDIIIAVDGADVLEIGYVEAVSRIRGTAGTEVTLTIRRGGVDRDLTFVREEIELITVAGEMLNNHIAYIRIESFKEATVTQFNNIFNKLIDSGAEAILFDLRDNGGGLVSATEDCLDPLLPEGEVAYAMYNDGTSQVLVTSDAEECNLPMVVLVNENSASAAEMFASALRDFGKAQLCGTTTYGKGIMQSTIPLEDGGGLTITVAQYRTANSDCYHGVGLTPELVVESVDDELGTDEQLDAAVLLLQKSIQ